MILIDDVTEACHGSCSHRNTRYRWEAEEVRGWEVECERIQADAIGPTPCIGYISATMKTQIMPKIAVQHSILRRAMRKIRDIREKSESREWKEKKGIKKTIP